MSGGGGVMRISTFSWALVGTLALSACCAPDRCYVARSRFEVLDPVISRLQSFEAERGRFPDTLEEAFPEGLPDGIRPLEGHKGYYGFSIDDGNFPTFSYGRFGRAGAPREVNTIHFRYVGGGLYRGMNDCEWTENDRSWNCGGYM